MNTTSLEMPASQPSAGIVAHADSATIWPSRCACDYGDCDNTVTAVVMVTSGGVVEVRTSCSEHVDKMHQGWADKQVAMVRVTSAQP